MDDLLVGGTNDDEHLNSLEAVFKQFLKFGLRVKLPKCMFMAPSVIYFGLRFSERGLQSTDEKVKAIKRGPRSSKRDGITLLPWSVSSTD